MLKIAKEIKESILLQIDRIKYCRYYKACNSSCDVDRHIMEAGNWLKRAQDWGDDRGVSYGARFGQEFLPSYPETTGYIIPTFLKLANFYRDDEYIQRAIEMGDWEVSIQLDSGAVMGGMVNRNPTPAVFNTGQVLHGWAALYSKTRRERYLEAGRRAADWLVKIQEENGNWLKFNSKFANPKATVYNVNAAWGLYLFGVEAGEEKYIRAATKNAEFALSNQMLNGWLKDCCLTDAQTPLVHTLAYAMQGLLEIGILTRRQDFINASRKTADALIRLMGVTGFIPGRIDSNFKGTVKWCCLTGSAQTSVVWGRFFELTKEERYREAMTRVNRYLMANHDITSLDPSIRGGVAGSWPVYGDYGQFMVLNWATKFLIDALLGELEVVDTNESTHHT